MSQEISHNVAYLAAKKSIDQRSLNQHVWNQVWQNCPDPPLQILELGAGIGTMVERLIEFEKISQADYTALDLNPILLQEARRRITSWSETNNLAVKQRADELVIQGSDINLNLNFQVADIAQGFPEGSNRDFDLLIANALLDLIDIPTALPKLLSLLHQDGLYYFTITFDGLTHFEPVIDLELDKKIIQLYHRTMDDRQHQERPAGHSRSGRILLKELINQGAEILAAGPSDWIIFPGADGYLPEEEILVAAILDTIKAALSQQSEIDPHDLDFWIERRRQQLRRQDLIYLAHQLDVCGRPPRS